MSESMNITIPMETIDREVVKLIKSEVKSFSLKGIRMLVNNSLKRHIEELLESDDLTPLITGAILERYKEALPFITPPETFVMVQAAFKAHVKSLCRDVVFHQINQSCAELFGDDGLVRQILTKEIKEYLRPHLDSQNTSGMIYRVLMDLAKTQKLWKEEDSDT